MKTVGVCGFGFTGSGAVLDCLSASKEVEVLDKVEFSFLYKPDGLQDLRYHLVENPVRYFSSDTAIRRFCRYMETFSKSYNRATNGEYSRLWKEFVDQIIQTTWTGTCSFHAVEAQGWRKYFGYMFIRRIRYHLDRHFDFQWIRYPEKTMYFSVNPDQFDMKAQMFTKKLLNAMRKKNTELLVVDQPFSADNPEKSFQYVENPMAIIVNKDPRDLYILAKHTLRTRGRFIPTDDVRSFVVYYREMMKNAELHKSNQALYIYFEDMIYQFEKTIEKISKYLNIEPDSLKYGSFDPKVSINNTMLFKRYPQYQREVDYIEKELSKWLYPFDESKYIEQTGKSF